VPTTLVLGMGASLGGLAMLQSQRSHPGVFAGLYLQSSSFFHRVLDEQESGFARFNRITAFVETVLRAGPARDPVPVMMSCGCSRRTSRTTAS
jgi:enterochelin esterase family protein